ncbi:MAG: hypothetical protein IKL85_09180 [Lentisphaeria bacterium]|nr:hypothetical protein [Lentisphaeria bacterium]
MAKEYSVIFGPFCQLRPNLVECAEFQGGEAVRQRPAKILQDIRGIALAERTKKKSFGFDQAYCCLT